MLGFGIRSTGDKPVKVPLVAPLRDTGGLPRTPR